MNCREFSLLLIELVRDPLPTTVHTQALQHAEQCSGCAAQLAQEQALTAELRLVTEAVAKREAPAWIEANLLAALREQTERKQAGHKRVAANPFAHWWSWQVAAGLAAAAALLIILVAGVARRKVGDVPQQQTAKQTVAWSQPEIRAAETQQIPPILKAGRIATRRPPSRRPTRPSAPPPSEELPFYSLITEGEMAPLESGRVVRMEVSPATLVNLGVPLTEMSLTQPVQADLLLGQDGLARAIRFLPHSQTTRSQ